MIGNIVVGILGSFIGGWLFARLGLFAGSGFLGAIILLIVLRLVRR